MANGFEGLGESNRSEEVFPAEPLAPIPASTSSRRGLPSTKDILERQRELALESIDPQLAQLFAGLRRARALAGGSQATALGEIGGQLEQLRQAFARSSRALARSFGPSGGGQVARGQQQLLGGFGQQVGGLFGQAALQGQANLFNLLGGFSPILSGQARPAQVATTPLNVSQLGELLAGNIQFARDLFPTQTNPFLPQETGLAGGQAPVT